MESLLANYASSDEEEGPQPSRPPSSSFSSTACSLFSSLPEPGQRSSNPTSPSFLSSLSPPDLAPLIDGKPTEGEKCAKPISLFSRLPQPQFRQSSSSLPKSKNIIQFKPHIPSALPNNSDNEDEDERQEDKDRRCPNQDHLFGQAASVKSFLSSIPAPKKSATLGVGASSGSARRSTIEAQVSASSSSSFGVEYPAYNQNAVNHGNYELSADQNAVSSVNYTGYGNLEWTVHQNYGEYANIATNENCELGGDQCCDVSGYGDYYKQYESNWSDGSASVVPQSTGMCEVARKVPGKRGRNELPVEILEVKQDELMKNRPREDQVKLTGIAFGPAYQPASTKGKPSKLHKRKHQIGSLYYDMRQKETELAERRARGFLTKAQTQAKYGW